MPRYLRPLIAIGLAVALAACTSCAPSNTALRAHSHAAETLDVLAVDAKELVLADRQLQLNKAAEVAKADGLAGDELRAAVERAAAKYDTGPAVPAVNAFINAKDAYVRAVLATAAKDTPSWTDVRPLLKDVVDAYSNLRKALGEPDNMPPVPDVIAKLLTRLEPNDPPEAMS